MRKELKVGAYIHPQPVLIIGTYDENGTPNAMNAAWGCTYDYDKVLIIMSDHKTTANILLNKAFTLSYGTIEFAKACDYVGLVSGNREPNKVEKAGWTVSKAEKVNAPIINELPICMECEFEECVNGEAYIGKVVRVTINEECLKIDGSIDLEKVNPIVFDSAGLKYRAVGKVVGNAFKDGLELK